MTGEVIDMDESKSEGLSGRANRTVFLLTYIIYYVHIMSDLVDTHTHTHIYIYTATILSLSP